jgi:hypothetical protein
MTISVRVACCTGKSAAQDGSPAVKLTVSKATELAREIGI